MIQEITSAVAESQFGQWQTIPLILATSLIGSAAIIWSTSSSVKRMGIEAAKMVGSLEAARQPTSSIATTITSIGKSLIEYKLGSMRISYEMRMRDINENWELEAENKMSAFIYAIYEIGIPEQDVDDIKIKEDDGIAYLSVNATIRDSNILTELNKIALLNGFTENKDKRSYIRESDVHEEAAERAMEDALRNRDATAKSLGINGKTLALASSEVISTDESNDCKIGKIAKIQWIIV